MDTVDPKRTKNPFNKVRAKGEVMYINADTKIIRSEICKKILARFEKLGYTFGFTLDQDFMGSDKNFIGTSYEVNFGNMVIGNTKKMNIRLMNMGELPLTFEISQAYQRKYNLRVEPEKFVKLSPNEEKIFSIS